jgi:hypothetical protein
VCAQRVKAGLKGGFEFARLRKLAGNHAGMLGELRDGLKL